MGYNTGSLQYVGTLQSPQKTHHQSTHTTEKQVSDPFIADSNPVVASSMLVFCAQNLQQEGRSLQQKGCFSVGCVDPRGFFLHRLQGPYVILRPSVPRHLYSYRETERTNQNERVRVLFIIQKKM